MLTIKPKTYCEKWPDGCVVCDLELCDGKRETAMDNLQKAKNVSLGTLWQDTPS